MIRYSTYRCILLLCILLISQSLTACAAKPGMPVINQMSPSPASTIPAITTTIPQPTGNIGGIEGVTPPPTVNDKEDIITVTPRVDNDFETPVPTNPLILSEESLSARGCSISLGESVDSFTLKLGSPNRIDTTEYDFDYYIYNNNYKRLLFVAVKEKKIVGFYTDSTDFDYNGIKSGSNLQIVNQSLKSSFTLKEVLTKKTDKYTVNILMDKIGTQSVTGIYVMPTQVKQKEYSDTVIRNIELMVYDLTNSIRVRNKQALLTWSSSAALSSRNHSKDMAQNNFFSHINQIGRKPGDRMREAGIYYSTCGENIIAGYGTAILSTHGWFNSTNHREVMLQSKFRYLGVGFEYNEESSYKTFITQNFYR